MRRKKLLCVVIAAMMIVMSSGCVMLDENGNSASLPDEHSESERFDTMLTDIFTEIAGDNLLDSRFLMNNPAGLGVTDIPKTVGRIDFEEIDNSAKIWQEELDELRSFDYSKLTEQQQYIYDLLEYDAELVKPVLSLNYYTEYNSPLLGIQSQLPTTLAEFRLGSVQDVYDYIEMLYSIQDFFDDLVKYQNKRSELGIFMPDRMLDETIAACKGFVKTPEQNLLIETFDARLDSLEGLENEERNKLIELNSKAVVEGVIPAYNSLVSGLDKLRGTGRDDKGLAHLTPDGKRYYEYLVMSGSGSERSAQEMITLLDQNIVSTMQRFVEIVVGNPDVYDKAFGGSLSSSETPELVLADLIEKSSAIVPGIEDFNYSIKYVHESMEENTSPAFYFIPAVDSTGDDSIYINRSNINSYATIYSLLGHEGYPGHMYQSNYFLQTNPHPIRRLLGTGGYDEGWASYVEEFCYEFSSIEDADALELVRTSDNIDLFLSARADLGVNYQGWDIARLNQELNEYGLGNEEVAESIYTAVVNDPGNYVKYCLGMLEFQELRARAMQELGDSFDVIEFHRTVLDVGSSPFSFVSDAVDDYILENKPSSSTKAA